MQEGVGEVTVCDLSVAGLLVLAAPADVGNLVVPPHDIVPVDVVVLFKLGIELQVLSNAHHDVLRRHTWLGLVRGLVPLALPEVEGPHAQSHIDDGALLS